MSKMKDVGVPLITCVLGIVGGYCSSDYLSRQAEERLVAREKQLAAKTAWEEWKSFYQQLQLHLEGSETAFQNQIAARSRLVSLLEKRIGTLPPLEYEPLFRQQYAQFSGEEKSLCVFMRGITLASVSRHNAAVLKLLEAHPGRMDELPSFRKLREHLDLWLSKYEGLKDREGWCLVYVGVEEKKPFPESIGQEVDTKLEELEEIVKQGASSAPDSEG